MKTNGSNLDWTTANTTENAGNEAKTEKTAIWLNGDDYEYEFAYCSNCFRMEYAGWYTHSEAQEKIPSFHEEYRYCPGCGAKMTGGSYIPKKTNRGRTKNGRKLG